MQTITRLDAIDLVPVFPPWVTQWGVALVVSGVAVALRAVVDMAFPYAAPYAVNFPLVLIATFFGRLRAGLITLILTTLFSWYFVVPVRGSFQFSDVADIPFLIVSFFSGLVLVALAELGRRGFRALLHEREERIGERDMLLREVDHRVKNNLAVLTSLLRLQQHESDSEEVKLALDKAAGRVLSLAKAYESLHYGIDNVAVVQLDNFLRDLCKSVGDALALGGAIKLVVSTIPCTLSRDRAAAIGLLVNEIVTNAAKHAFVGRETGTITVSLSGRRGRAELIIADDGIGLGDDVRLGAQGRRYLEAFATIAKAELDCVSDANGTRYTAVLENLP